MRFHIDPSASVTAAVEWVFEDMPARVILAPDLDAEQQVWDCMVELAPRYPKLYDLAASPEKLHARFGRHVMQPRELRAMNRREGARWEPDVWVLDVERVLSLMLHMSARRLLRGTITGPESAVVVDVDAPPTDAEVVDQLIGSAPVQPNTQRIVDELAGKEPAQK